MQDKISPSVDDTIGLAVADLRSFVGTDQPHRRESAIGFDIHAHYLAARWASPRTGGNHNDTNRLVERVVGVFYEALWELCRRGILRPGARSGTKHGATDGGGYCLTEHGRAWISSATAVDLIVLQQGSLAATLSAFKPRFGEAFHQRSQEAIRCRNAEAWFACCAMTGAASEAVLLSIAIEKSKDEPKAIATYLGRDGRRATINAIVGQSKSHVGETLRTFMGLLAYWRDAAAHGQATVMSNANADEALRQLLHLCQWVDKNWTDLTS